MIFAVNFICNQQYTLLPTVAHNLKAMTRNLHILRAILAPSRRNLASLAYTTYESAAPQQQPPLIVNHGLFGSKSNWNSLCKVYQKKTARRVIAADARNHGESPHTDEHSYELLVADLKELLAQLNLERVALLGHSMGGRAVMYFALKYPRFVERLIVADISPVRTSPNLRKTPELFDVMRGVELPSNVPMSKARVHADKHISKYVEDKGLRNFLLTNLVQKDDGSFTWRINIETLMSNFENLATFPEVHDVRYDGPVLFIGGGNSDYISHSDHPGIKKLFPRAEFKYIEGAGHWLHSEKPNEFLEHTVRFLNEN